MSKFTLRGALLFVLFAAVFIVSSAGAASAAVYSPDISRMIQESPYFTEHEGANGVIWLKESDYSLRADGAMVRRMNLVILARRGIDEKWTRWSFPVPEGGSVKVLSASLYDPGSGRILSPVLPRTAEQNGAAFTEAMFPDLQEEFIIVLSVEEILPRVYAAEDFLWVSEELPLWEQRVTVNVPAGMELYVESRGAGEPRRTRSEGGERYEWQIVNNPAWSGRTLKADDRGFISFSTRKGTEALARKLASLEGVLTPPAPAAVQKTASQGTPLKTGQSVIDWVNRAPGFPAPFPSNYVRSEIPQEGPWTEWEKTLLLYRWIRRAGWESKLHWLAAYPPGDASPAPAGLVIRPVLELSAPGVSPFYCDPGRAGGAGVTPPSLWGKHLVTASGTGVTGRTVSGSAASEHRLSVEWLLNLDKTGAAEASADVFVRNGWVNFFFPGGKPDGESLDRMASELFPGVRFLKEERSFAPIKYGWKVSLKAEPRQAIVSGGAMLVPLPGAVPSWMGELASPSGDFTLKFPFVMEQSFVLKMPPKSEVVMAPQTANRELEKVKYSESVYHNKRRNTITTGSKIIVTTDKASDLAARGLAEAARRWLDYASRTIPLRVKSSLSFLEVRIYGRR